MRWRRRLVASAALVVIGGLVAGFGFAPLVRWRMQSIAAARRVSATVGTVTPGWFGLNLRDVRLTPAGVPVEVGLRDVRVDLSPMLSPSRVEARQVNVQILGDAEAVEAAIRAWEEGRRTDSRDSPTGLLPVTVGGVSVVWRAQPGDAPIAEVAGGSLERSSFGWRGAFESAHLRQGALSLGASGVSASASRTGAIREMHASRLSVAWTGEAGALAATPPLAAANPTPPPLPLVGASLPATDPDASMAARFHIPELRTLRARLAVLTSLIERQLTEDANVNIDALEFGIGEGARLLSNRARTTLRDPKARRARCDLLDPAQYEWDARLVQRDHPARRPRRGPFVCGRAYLARTSGVRGGGGGIGRCRSDHGKRARAGGDASCRRCDDVRWATGRSCARHQSSLRCERGRARGGRDVDCTRGPR